MLICYVNLLLTVYFAQGVCDLRTSCVNDLITMSDKNYSMALSRYKDCKEVADKNILKDHLYLRRIGRNLQISNKTFQKSTKLSKDKLQKITDLVNELYIEMLLSGILPVEPTDINLPSTVPESDIEEFNLTNAEGDYGYQTFQLESLKSSNNLNALPYFLLIIFVVIILNFIMLSIIYGYLQRLVCYVKECLNINFAPE
ncbi:uncharacterized protein [Rhodnius prolixus]|uniref:Uncharacterized protein n=1 Tax=Rhodnius prolixus TaxID=13249 RepID=T1HK89_RHOPR